MTRKWNRTCPECGVTFEVTSARPDRQFCSDAHKAAFHNRSSRIGRVVVPLAMAWREGRNVKGQSPEAKAKRASAARALNELCRLLDAESADDRANNRVGKLDVIRRRWAASGDLRREETAAYHQPKDAKASA